MENKNNKRPRFKKQANGKGERKVKQRMFKAVYPEYFTGDISDRIVFVKTSGGYVAKLDNKRYIGMPKDIIENTSSLFMEV